MITIRWLDNFKLYEDQQGMRSYIERVVRKIVNALERAYCKRLKVNALKAAQPDCRNCNEPVIVSLTTFPARIDYVHLAIMSLLNQTVKPERIILWLASEQFRDVKIPDTLKDLCRYGLEIRYCEEDILAHKKYYYAMRTFPEHIIVTYDDDIIYPEDSLKKLLIMHRNHPNAIICNRGREIEIHTDTVAPYRYWKVSGKIPAGVPTHRVMASTGAGTLYPPHCMPEETFDLEKIRELALTADDLWMKVMSIKGGIPVVKAQTRNKALCISTNYQKEKLANINVTQNMNEYILLDLLQQYPETRQALLNNVNVL